jgi:hypothetical protein
MVSYKNYYKKNWKKNNILKKKGNSFLSTFNTFILFLNVEIIFKILTCAIQSLVSKCLTLSFVIYLTFLSSIFFFFFHIFKQKQNLKALLARQVKFHQLVKVLVYLVMLVKHPTLTKTPVKIVLLAHMN